MVYDERDQPWRSFPGVYVSMPRSSFDARFQRSWGYFRIPEVVDRGDEPDLLWSFVGSLSHPARRPLLSVRHPDALVEEVPPFVFWDTAQPDFHARRDHFRSVLMRSRFVLCPRGRGTSTYRLYEVLAAGRIPATISDEWISTRARLGRDQHPLAGGADKWTRRGVRGTGGRLAGDEDGGSRRSFGILFARRDIPPSRRMLSRSRVDEPIEARPARRLSRPLADRGVTTARGGETTGP